MDLFYQTQMISWPLNDQGTKCMTYIYNLYKQLLDSYFYIYRVVTLFSTLSYCKEKIKMWHWWSITKYVFASKGT
jgi:hypothetical protein